MTELSKLFSTVLLLAAGFFGASMFGPPELTERLIGRWATPPVSQGEGLRPLDPGQTATPAPFSVAPATPARVAPSFSPVPLPVPPLQQASPLSTNVQPSKWQTPDFAAKPVADPNPMSGPSADFNAWLGAAGDWLDRENETAQASTAPSYQRDTAVAPVADFDEPASPQTAVAWLLPRDTATDVSTSPTSGPSLFANQQQAVSRQPTATDPWGAWDNSTQATPVVDFPAQLGPSPLENSRRTYEAGYAPVARSRMQTNYGTHIVTDGDTLPDLAKRYLGDAARAEELYQLNRDRLDHPDLLPIGVVLRMPDEPRRTKPPANDWSQQQLVRNGPFSTVSSGAELREEPSRLVPIGGPTEKPARLSDAKYADEWSW